MNFNDSEIVASVLSKEGFALTKDIDQADLVLLNTCSIRENAEVKIRSRLRNIRPLKKKNKKLVIGILGCMAERLKSKLLEEEKLVDIVCGPDAYRELPQMFLEAKTGQKAVNVLLSREETYADINPVRLDSNGVTSYVSIMRGCDNMCSFCVVPFTRGRERSRSSFSIVAEAQDLFDKGYKEVTLLGQNVDSYKWENPETKEIISFADLLVMVAKINPALRVRFSTSHPKDITDEVMYAIRDYENICNYIHLPVQSGNSRILEKMNRTYDREWYISKVDRIREIIPNCAITTDFITGFCSETEEEHRESISMQHYVKYEMAYMYFYSERPGTLAGRKYEDDIPLEVKKRRLAEIIEVQLKHSLERNKQDLGTVCKVLIEKQSKKSANDWCGRNDHNKMVIFPKGNHKLGDYVYVKIETCTSATLQGKEAVLEDAVA
ncbi:UNVERIFIED_CONTAM: hypothetical protein GTU68_013207 [Idotea baltica]|nr:hypothetical protein [Idotea baltica]